MIRLYINLVYLLVILSSVSGCLKISTQTESGIEQESSSGEIDMDEVDMNEVDMDEVDMNEVDMNEVDMNEVDMNEVDMNIMEILGSDLCDGLDNNGDGRIDEILYEAPTSLILYFSQASAVDSDFGRIYINYSDGTPVDGSPFTGGELESRELVIESDEFIITIELMEGATPTLGYEIESITDRSGQEMLGPYPRATVGEDGLTEVPLFEQIVYSAGNSRGEGRICGLSVGMCRTGRYECLGGILSCEGDINETEEICDGLDNDCDGAIDEGLEIDPPLCDNQLGVCKGSTASCAGENGWVCYYRQLIDYQSPEQTCDCLDNDCNGQIDQNQTETLSCDLGVLMAVGEGRDCIIRSGGILPSGKYEFKSLTISEGVDIEVPPAPSGIACGYEGVNRCMKGGGCLTLKAESIVMHGQISANAEELSTSIDSLSFCGGSSGGDIVLEAYSVELDGRLQANGSAGWQRDDESNLAGGGAGGSIRIFAHDTQFLERALIESHGGRGSDLNNPDLYGGSGPGGRGGEHGGAGAGSGGSGGSGGSVTPGSENMNRGVEILGSLETTTFEYLSALNGAGQTDGYLYLGGESSSAMLETEGLTLTQERAILHIYDINEIPYSDQNICLTAEEDQMRCTPETSLGQSDSLGWIEWSDEANTLNDSTPFFVIVDGQENGFGYAFISIYDPVIQWGCSATVTLDNGRASFHPLTLCP